MTYPGLTPSIKWNPALSFAYSISSDSMTVTCAPATSLPANTTITWTLNPPDATLAIMDDYNDPLPLTTGSFTTGSGAQPADTNFCLCSLTKTADYTQTGPSTLAVYSNVPAFYSGSVAGTSADPVASASLTISGVSQARAFSTLPGQTDFSDLAGFGSQALMDAAFPTGIYTFNAQRQSGPLTAQVTVTSDYPPAPMITNFNAAQAINPSAAFTFQWTPIPNTESGDSIYFYIDDANSADVYAVTNGLDNTTASVTIPAGLLNSNTIYQGILCFSRPVFVSTNTANRVIAMAGLTRATYFPITTAGAAPPAPRFTSYYLTNGQISASVSGPPGGALVIEYCTNWNGWTTVLTTNIPPAGSIVYSDAIPPGNPRRFYRARTGK